MTTPHAGVVAQMNDVLSTLIERIGRHLQSECINRCGVIHVPYRLSARRPFHGPALITEGASEDAQQIVRLLYGRTVFVPQEIPTAWDHVANALIERRPSVKLRQTPRMVFPDLPYSETTGGRDEAAQFLAACDWLTGGLRVDQHEVLLRVGGLTLGFDGAWILKSDGTRRRRRGDHLIRPDMLRRPLGRPHTSTPALGALHQYLVTQLPDLAPTVGIVCAVAVHAGRPYERLLTALFDTEYRVAEEGDDTSASLWGKARAVAEDSTGNPLPGLARLLIPLIGRRQFQRHFGNPYRMAQRVNQKTRRRLLTVIDALESGDINLPEPTAPRLSSSVRKGIKRRTKDVKEAKEVMDIMQLQRLIGGLS